MPAELDPKPRQLPSGRHGLPRDAVLAQQRRRMFDAIAAVLRHKGFVALTVEDVASRAGVSRRTFYEHFGDKTDCFLGAYRDAVERLIAQVSAATADAAGTEAQARAALAATLRFFAADVDVAHLTVIEVLGAGPRALAAHDEALRRLVAFIAADEPVSAAEHPPPRMILQMLAGEVSQAVYAEVLHDRASELERLDPMLAYLMLAPMYGPVGAARRSGLATAQTPPGGAARERPDRRDRPTPAALAERRTAGAPLPRGRHGLPRAVVIDNQRERMINSMAAMASAKGYARVTVSDVTGHAGVSRRTFYDQFEDKNDCFLAAFDSFSARLLGVTAAAARATDPWPAQVSGGLAALLDRLSAEPAFARVAVVEALSAGRPALERRDAVLDRLAALLQPTSGPAPGAVIADRRLARAIVGGAYETLYERLLAGEPSLIDLMPDLLYCALVPYLGHAAALAHRDEALAAG